MTVVTKENIPSDYELASSYTAREFLDEDYDAWVIALPEVKDNSVCVINNESTYRFEVWMQKDTIMKLNKALDKKKMRLNILNITANSESNFYVVVSGLDDHDDVKEFKERFIYYKYKNFTPRLRDHVGFVVEPVSKSKHKIILYLDDGCPFTDYEIESIKKYFDHFNSSEKEGTLAQKATKRFNQIFGISVK